MSSYLVANPRLDLTRRPTREVVIPRLADDEPTRRVPLAELMAAVIDSAAELSERSAPCLP